MVFSFDGSAAETLMAIENGINLLIYYVAGANEHRIRTLDDVIFIGDAEVVVPGAHTGIGELDGLPWPPLPEKRAAFLGVGGELVHGFGFVDSAVEDGVADLCGLADVFEGVAA